MISITDFHYEFEQNIFANANSKYFGYNHSFFESVCDELIATGELPENIEYAYLKKTVGKHTLETNGYSYDDEREILYLISSEFFQTENKIESLTSKKIEQKIRMARNYTVKALERFYSELEPTSSEYEMSKSIYEKYKEGKINKIKILLISDGRASKSYLARNIDSVYDIPIDTAIIDIEYLYANFMAQNADSSFSINVKLPYLKVPTTADKYSAYLIYITGEQIYNIYEEYGKRILEQNVRTFLQFKGGVNKGLKNTISKNPDMFFAYNNGITATASEVHLNDKNEIIKIDNFQIVNGGQTTSAIYAAKKNNKIDISKILIQMKLSVINNTNMHSNFVSKVAEYANTQNKINNSDFFSNSPFHKEFKNYSNSTWAPSLTENRHKWFYERVRGEYMNEQAYKTKSEKKKFEIMHPRSKKFDKTFLAKSEVAWLQMPHKVSQGAQKSFITFADYVNEMLTKDELFVTEEYYKEAVSRIILFKFLEQLISNSKWFNGGFRSNIVAYSISYFSYTVALSGKKFSFKKIWNEQKIPEDLNNEFQKLCEEIFNFILDTPKNHGNPSQWSKKVGCWEELKKRKLNFNVPDYYFLSKDEESKRKVEEKKMKKVDQSIEIQKIIFELDFSIWVKLFEYFSDYGNRKSIDLKSYEILESMVKGRIVSPSEKQSKYLYSLYNIARTEGLDL